MSRQEKDYPDYVLTGPGTIAGRYLRQFWQPVFESSKLKAGRVVPLRIMGENFTLYRGESGTTHVVGPLCPHRLTLLSTGNVCDDTIECRYHGWRFDGTGACVDQPAEPRPFSRKVSIDAHPTEEYLGLIFAYFGEGTPPPLPRWSELEHGKFFKASIEKLPCNYFQSAENIMDDVHVRFSHAGAPRLSASRRAGIPGVSAEETAYGFVQHLALGDMMEHNYFIMPNICYLVVRDYGNMRGQPVQHLFFYVPIDDTSHYHVRIDSIGFTDEAAAKPLPSPPSRASSVEEEIQQIIAGEKKLNDVLNHPELVRIQDGVAIVGQGVIADRSRERLGKSDAAIILLRKVWLRELRSLAEGHPSTPVTRPDNLDGLEVPGKEYSYA